MSRQLFPAEENAVVVWLLPEPRIVPGDLLITDAVLLGYVNRHMVGASGS
ncbi:MAG: hypothetical protein HOE54_10730 [Gammaproteobacteria bacterium]|nr:hypothetical protein [Gammaproteobacteria bacterium]MBT7371898.1 hypothetical protein [Gammaproteobacteria bacterium]